MANPAYHDTLEQLSNRLANEIVFAREGFDDGLIPAFSLLSDLLEVAEENELRAPLEEAREKIEGYLDAASAFDRDLLAYLSALVTWLPDWIQAVRTGRPSVPFDALKAAAGGGTSEVSDTLLSDSAGPCDPRVAVSSSAASTGKTLEGEAPLLLRLEENRELLAEFHAEAVDHLDHIEAALLALDDNPEDRDGINSLFRSFHTLKGNAGFLQLVPMQRLCHEVESLLDLARSGKLRLNPTIITAILNSRDVVQALLNQIFEALAQNAEPQKVVPVNTLIAQVADLAVKFGEAERLAEDGHISRADEVAVPGAISGEDLQTLANENGNPDGLLAGGTARRSSSVRVNTEKLDQLMDVVGELVIVQGQILASAADAGASTSSLERNLNQLTRITKDLQHTAMALRMVPIKPTFQKMERLVRDLEHRMGRKVALEVTGEGTEVDRTVVEEIADPLVHMIRNALDHGIEPEAERLSAGKAPVGRLCLRAFHQGGNIIIELEDDGRGIDSDKVRAKAKEKGLLAPGQVLSESEALMLIFAPGFSTASRITDVSGRGVGMDVVRRNIDRLRGTIEVTTARGRGSTFRIRLPLTMAIIDGLVLRVGADQFVLPTNAVKIALRPRPEHVVRVQGKGEVIDHRGKLLPLVRLHERFTVAGAETDPTRGMVVLIEHAGRSSALLVDEMVKKQEVVIKNLGGFFASVPGIAGGAILGDGNIALILDPPALISAA